MKKLGKVFLALLFVLSLSGLVNAQPVSPTNLTATQSAWGQYLFIQLNWKPDINRDKDSFYFNVYRKIGGVSDTGSFHKMYTHVHMNFWIDKYVQRGETYSYYVTAENNSGESAPSDTAVVSIDSNLAKGVISGTLKDNSTNVPIVNARVAFIPVFGWDLTFVKTDSMGNFSADLLPGTYLIYTNAEGYYPEYYNNVRDIFHATKVQLNSGDSLSFDITMQSKIVPTKYMLSGTVTDTAGNPLKAWIEVYNVAHNTYHWKYYHAVTDTGGHYSIHVRGGDTVVVFAHPFNHDYISQFYNDKNNFMDADRIPITSDTNGIDFVMSHKPVYNNGISGVVKNDSSMGVNAIIFAIRLNDRHDFHKRYSTITDSLGNYSFSHMYPGNYILLAIPDRNYEPTFFRYDGMQTLRWKNADSVVVNASGTVAGINFTVMADTDSGADLVNGTVRDNLGNPVNGAFVFALDANQQVSAYGITDQNGNYTIAGLTPGSYSISTDKYGYTSTQTSTVSLDYNSNFTSSASFTMTPTDVTSINSNSGTIQNYKLYQNYPNPFNPTTVIKYSVPMASRVTLKVYNILGSEVATLVNGEKAVGNYNVTFNGSNLASGIYFYQLKAGGFVQTKKLVLMK
jgi:protocatechuate 3,4-dioxygenase beta subunit